jgi:hypothetical protein
MAVAVPETDVFAAADRVLARGERPTVERVRTELGRGSPARVGQLLDVWWEALAKRLAGETRLPELPAEVAQAFRTVWATATAHSQQAAEVATADAAAQLVADRTALVVERDQWRNELQAATTGWQEAERTRGLTELHLADLQTVQKQAVVQNVDLTDQRDTLRQQYSEAMTLIAALRGHLDERDAALASARTDHDAHIRAVEDRAHTEVDRGREELKTLRTQLQQLQKTYERALLEGSRQREVDRAALHRAEREASAQAARAVAVERQLAAARRAKPQPKAKRLPAKRLRNTIATGN